MSSRIFQVAAVGILLALGFAGAVNEGAANAAQTQTSQTLVDIVGTTGPWVGLAFLMVTLGVLWTMVTDAGGGF